MHPWEWAARRRKQDELVDTARLTLELKAKDRTAAQPRRPKKGNTNRGHGKSRRRR